MNTKNLWTITDSDYFAGKTGKSSGKIINSFPILIKILLKDKVTGMLMGNICTVDYYCIPGGFEKRLTAYGRERIRICAGGYDGCTGPVTKNEFNEPLCKSCFKEKQCKN